MKIYYVTYGITGLDMVEVNDAKDIDDAKEKANKIMAKKFDMGEETIIGYEAIRIEDENNNIVWGI